MKRKVFVSFAAACARSSELVLATDTKPNNAMMRPSDASHYQLTIHTMREIKFRAWDGSRMWFDVQNAYDYIGGDQSNNGDAIPSTDFEGVLSDMQVMQFTGLHDKNGKEIYEGDVANYLEFPRIVAWENARFVLNHIDRRQLDLDHNALDHIEVIGNIYENPELLTV